MYLLRICAFFHCKGLCWTYLVGVNPHGTIKCIGFLLLPDYFLFPSKWGKSTRKPPTHHVHHINVLITCDFQVNDARVGIRFLCVGWGRPWSCWSGPDPDPTSHKQCIPNSSIDVSLQPQHYY